MLEYFQNILQTGNFMPHGHCYFWQPGVLWTNVVGDGLIALSYYFIPLALIYFARKKQEPEFNKVLWLFGAFILLCGTTHLLHIYTVWVPSYKVEGLLKILTGLVSLFTTIYIYSILPKALKIPTADQFQRANQNMAELSYTVAHDLRSPIRHINSFATMMIRNKKNNLSEAEIENLGKISGISIEIGKKIDALLNYTKLEQQDFKLELVEINELIRKITMQYDSGQEQEINWIIDELPPCIADAQMMQIVFQNLIENAIKYSQKEVSPRIKIEGKQLKTGWRYTITDNGIGFDMKYKNKLFQPFERLHNDPFFEGYGIGLANVNRIIHRHKGSIQAKSAPGKGSTFIIDLPKNQQ